MSDTNPTGATGTAQLSAVEAFIKGVKQDAPATEAPAETPKVEAKPPGPSPLTDGIRKMREEREKAQAEQARKAQFESENEQLKREVEKYKRSSNFEDDPIGYAKSRGWDREQQLTFAKALMYDLAPDQADPNFRIQMFEAKQRREQAQKAKEAEEAKLRETQEASVKEIRKYAEDMEAAVLAFEAGSYPESEAWYEDSVEEYLGDMFKTANKLAKEASKRGVLADLSPQAVAKQLEADVAARLSRRDQRKQPAQKTQQAAPAPEPMATDTKQSVDTTSTKDLSGGGGAPQPPATSEKERIQRAIAAAWKTR